MQMRVKTWLLVSLGTLGLGGGMLTWAEASKQRAPLRVIPSKPISLPPSQELRQGAKLLSPSGVWTWFDIPGTKCGYGKVTGLAINPSPNTNADTLLLFLQGGGACWKESGAMGGCFSYPRSAFGLSGINQKQFRGGWRLRRIKRSFLFQRKHDKNPLKNAHYALIPYCTGDLHAGHTTVQFSKNRTLYFHGYANMLEYLRRLVPTFSGVKRVILAGASAGGVGASLHWQRVQRAFGPNVQVDLLNDSGAPITPPPARWKHWRQLWNLQMPEGCSQCPEGIEQIFLHYSRTMFKKGRKMAFLGHTDDRVIRTFLGLHFFGNQYVTRLRKTLKRFDKHQRAHYFILPGGYHVMQFRRKAETLRAKDGTHLGTWLRHFVNRDPAWHSVHP